MDIAYILKNDERTIDPADSIISYSRMDGGHTNVLDFVRHIYEW